MGVFDSVSSFAKLRKEGLEKQKELQAQKITGESKNSKVKIYMNSTGEMEDLYIDEEWFDNVDCDEMKKAFKEAYKDYMKKLQKTIMSSFDMDKLKDMLGK